MGAVSWVLPGRSSECNPAPVRIVGRGMGLSIRDERRARKKLSTGSPLATGSLDPLSGVYASRGAGRYEVIGGGVTDLGEYLIRGGFGIIASFESSNVIGALAT